METNEKKIAEKACEVYAGLNGRAREAFVNQLEGMAFVIQSQRGEEKQKINEDHDGAQRPRRGDQKAPARKLRNYLI